MLGSSSPRSIIESEMICDNKLYGVEDIRKRRLLYEQEDRECQKRGRCDDGLMSPCGAYKTGKVDLQSIKKYSKNINQEFESPYGLLEELLTHDPWSLFISTILLNKTSRLQVDKVLPRFFFHYKDASTTAAASKDHIYSIIHSLGLGHKRAQSIIKFSAQYQELIVPTCKKSLQTCNSEVKFSKKSLIFLTNDEVLSLPAVGQYALDAYCIFIRKEFISSCDYALSTYVDYQRGLKMKEKIKS